MPTYEYECAKCRKNFDAFQSMKDDAYKTCPKDLCRMKTWGKGKVRRLLGAGAGLIFKGSGFYITDYRSEGYNSAAKSDPKGDSPPVSPKPTEGSSSPASSATKKTSTTESTKSKTPPSKQP